MWSKKWIEVERAAVYLSRKAPWAPRSKTSSMNRFVVGMHQEGVDRKRPQDAVRRADRFQDFLEGRRITFELLVVHADVDQRKLVLRELLLQEEDIVERTAKQSLRAAVEHGDLHGISRVGLRERQTPSLAHSARAAKPRAAGPHVRTVDGRGYNRDPQFGESLRCTRQAEGELRAPVGVTSKMALRGFTR